MARRATKWFNEEGRPIMHEGMYKNTPDGEFLYDFRLKGQHPKGSLGIKNETQARAKLDAMKQRIHDEHFGVVSIVPPTMRELWADWDKQVGAVKSATYRRYMKGVVSTHLQEWADLPASALTSDVLETLRARYMSSEGEGFKRGGGHTVRRHSEGGWNRVFGQIRTLLKWALMKKRIKAMPYEIPAKSIRLTASAKAHGVLWPEEVPAFLDAVDIGERTGKGGRGKKGSDPYRATSIAIRLMIRLGLREGEALNLEWDRVDWRRKIIIIAEAQTTGRRVKDRSVRKIPMGPQLEAYLREWWHQQDKPKAGLVILNDAGWAYFDGATAKAVHRGSVALERHLTPHGLRATFATGHWEVGTPLTQIAQMMGDSPEVVMKHYIHERPKDQAAAQARLEEAMEGHHIPELSPTPRQPNQSKVNKAHKKALSGS